MKKINPYIHILVIAILGFIIYANSLKSSFIWDDYGLIKDNNYIKHWVNLPKIVIEDFGAGGGTRSNFYRPLQMILHMAGYSLWGLNVIGYHLTSVFLHILTAIALYFFVYAIVCNTSIAFLASLLFVTHPINTEAVCYISGVSDPLSLLFILLCFIFYIKSLNSKSIAPYLLALLIFAVALLSKENAVIVPILILLYHYSFRKNLEIKKVIPFFIILLSYVLLRLTILNPFIQIHVPITSLLQKLPGCFVALAEFSKLLLLPFNLHVEYGNKVFNISDPRVITGALLSLLLIIFAFLKRKQNPLVFFSIGWFFIAFLPVSNIYPINDSFMMEHWIYTPSIGFFIILSNLIYLPLKNKRLVFLLRTLVIALIVFYSYLTIKQNEYWKEPIAFYKRTLKYAPDSWRFYNELGIEYANSGKTKEAIECYTKSLEINPNLSGVYNNLGNLYRQIGKNDEALAMYKKAKEIDK